MQCLCLSPPLWELQPEQGQPKGILSAGSQVLPQQVRNSFNNFRFINIPPCKAQNNNWGIKGSVNTHSLWSISRLISELLWLCAPYKSWRRKMLCPHLSTSWLIFNISLLMCSSIQYSNKIQHHLWQISSFPQRKGCISPAGTVLLCLLHRVSLWEQRLLHQVDKTQTPFPRHIGPSGGVISFAEDGGQEHNFLAVSSGQCWLSVCLVLPEEVNGWGGTSSSPMDLRVISRRDLMPSSYKLFADNRGKDVRRAFLHL